MYKYLVLWHYNPNNRKIEYRAGLEIDIEKYESGKNKLIELYIKCKIDDNRLVVPHNLDSFLLNPEIYLTGEELSDEVLFETEDRIEDYRIFFSENIGYLVEKYGR